MLLIIKGGLPSSRHGKGTLKSTSVSVCFRGISQLPSAFIFYDDSNLHISLFKYVLSTMGVIKESISKFLIGNRFHVKLCILSPYSNRIQ